MTESKFGVVDEFSTRFSKQSGMLYHAKNPDEAATIINDLIATRRKGDSCASDDLTILGKGSKTNISGQIRASVRMDALQSDARKLIGQIDVGVTKAQYGVGETGTIVDISYTDEHRLLSSLTRVHIAILEESSILDKLSRLSPIIRSLLKAERKPSITFIGGPSRTSDIELKSVLGVHGPHEVHCVLVS
jgi:L-lactate utilization protein LutC